MNNILLFFKHLGYNSSDLIGQKQLHRLLQSIPFEQNNNQLQYLWKKQIFHQVWENSAPDKYRRVVVLRYIKQLYSQHHILGKQVSRKTQQQKIVQQEIVIVQRKLLQIDQELVKLLNMKLNNLQYLSKQYNKDLDQLSFQKDVLINQFQSIIQCNNNQSFLKDNDSTEENGENISNNSSLKSHKVYDRKLRLLFILTCSYVLLEMLIMICKYSFLDLLIGFLLLSIFLFSCFNHSYVKIILLFLASSFIFDIVWIIVRTKNYWSPNDFSYFPIINIYFQRFVIFMVILQIIIKSFVVYFLWPWRRLETEDIFYVKTIGIFDCTLIRSQAKIKLQEQLIDQVFCGVIY